MRRPVVIAIPVILPRGALLWALVRLILAALPLAASASFGSVPQSPIAVVLLCVAAGLIDVGVRRERMLWANLGVQWTVLCAGYAAAATVGECLLALVVR